MKCTMHSSFSLSRHNWWNHINIMMRVKILYGVLASHRKSNTATHKRGYNMLLQLQYLETMMWSWTVLSVMSAEMKTLCPTARGSFAFKSLAMCSYDRTVQSGFALRWHKRPQPEQLDRLHVIGRVKTQPAVFSATFPPALLVLLQLHQLVPWNRERTKKCTTGGHCVRQFHSL